MTKNHSHYLDLAFQLAEKNLGQTGLNPSVGTIVVKNDTVISTGITSVNGRPHSEFNALNKLKNCSGASLYVTLEPCTHHGKTPPCVNMIVKKKIKNVYYAFNDPDLRTFQKAKKFLKTKGIKSKLIRSKKYSKFYKGYFLNKKKQIPLVNAKIAISKDYLTVNKKKKWITNNASRKIVHFLRNKYDSILSTSKSINADNSLLNCRIEGLNNSKPDLFIIDLGLKLKKRLLLNNLLKNRKTYLIISKKQANKTMHYVKKGFKIIIIDSLKNRDDLNTLLKKIYKMGYSRILVEAGLNFLNYLLKNKMLNEIYIFKSDLKLGKAGKNYDTPKYLKKLSPKLLKLNLYNDKLYRREF